MVRWCMTSPMLRSEVAICCWQMGCGLGSQAAFYNRWGAVASASLWSAKQVRPISTVIRAEAPANTLGPRFAFTMDGEPSARIPNLARIIGVTLVSPCLFEQARKIVGWTPAEQEFGLRVVQPVRVALGPHFDRG
jgi:hypothetical protein